MPSVTPSTSSAPSAQSGRATAARRRPRSSNGRWVAAGPRRCSVCRQTGHQANSPNCPLIQDVVSLRSRPSQPAKQRCCSACGMPGHKSNSFLCTKNTHHAAANATTRLRPGARMMRAQDSDEDTTDSSSDSPFEPPQPATRQHPAETTEAHTPADDVRSEQPQQRERQLQQSPLPSIPAVELAPAVSLSQPVPDLPRPQPLSPKTPTKTTVRIPAAPLHRLRTDSTQTLPPVPQLAPPVPQQTQQQQRPRLPPNMQVAPVSVIVGNTWHLYVLAFDTQTMAVLSTRYCGPMGSMTATQ